MATKRRKASYTGGPEKPLILPAVRVKVAPTALPAVVELPVDFPAEVVAVKVVETQTMGQRFLIRLRGLILKPKA